MSTDLTRRLSAWLAATDIGYLELRGPGVHLCLQNDGHRVVPVPPGTAPQATTATLPVKAASVGVYLHAHPLHDTHLAAAGQPLVAGQAVGLLRIGALLLPVVAPQGGVMRRHLVGHDTAVGYGTVVAEITTSHPA